MVFVSCKDALRGSLFDIGAELKATEFSEVAFEAGKSLKFIISSESMCCACSPLNLVNERLFKKKASTGT